MKENNIYYKNSPENPESLFHLLKDYFEKKSPATYDSVTHAMQCNACCNRSIDDLLLLSNHYFPNTDVNILIKTLQEISLDRFKKTNSMLCVFACSGICKPVVLNQLNWSGTDLIHNLFYKPSLGVESYNQYCNNSEFKYTDLIKILG